MSHPYSPDTTGLPSVCTKPKRTTCYCSAYPFPHRLNGGKCNVHTFADYYLLNRSDMCNECPNKHSEYGWKTCTVVDGDNSSCPAFNIAEYTGRIPE